MKIDSPRRIGSQQPYWGVGRDNFEPRLICKKRTNIFVQQQNGLLPQNLWRPIAFPLNITLTSLGRDWTFSTHCENPPLSCD
jgi:hypothetical protein